MWSFLKVIFVVSYSYFVVLLQIQLIPILNFSWGHIIQTGGIRETSLYLCSSDIHISDHGLQLLV